MNTLEAAITH